MAESVKNHKTIILTIYLQMQGVMTKTMPILTFLWHFNNGNRIFLSLRLVLPTFIQHLHKII
jgi:hypothetical protein